MVQQRLHNEQPILSSAQHVRRGERATAPTVLAVGEATVQGHLLNTPAVWRVIGTTLDRKASNVVVGSPFVMMFTYCSPVGTWSTWRSPSWTHCRTKWMSSSMCLVCLWCMGLQDMHTAETLSQYATVAFEMAQWSSPSRCQSQMHSAAAFSTAWYSAFQPRRWSGTRPAVAWRTKRQANRRGTHRYRM